MAVSIDKKFRFVSPGVFIDEVDNSQLPKQAAPIGPVIIGRTERGPGMMPVQVDSFSDFVEIFGDTVPGGSGDDVWRDGNFTSPMYATYAAQAWLKNSNRATVVRLLGDQSSNATGTKAGWDIGGDAYGLFLINSASNQSSLTGTLAAVFYTNASGVEFQITGTVRNEVTTSSGRDVVVRSLESNSATTFVGQISSSAGVVDKTKFNFDENSEFYIRKVFNTNPIFTNSTVSSTTKNYFLGETFEENVRNVITSTSVNYAVVFKLYQSANADYANHLSPSQKAATGWIFAQDLGTSSAYVPTSAQKLFKLWDLGSGDSNQSRFKISIQDIKPASNAINPYGTFSVVLRKAEDNDASPKIVEIFTSCDLNPLSENYVAKKIGSQYMDWSDDTNSYTLKGDYPNNSKFIRVEMNTDVEAGSANPAYLPFGCYLPTRPANFLLTGQDIANSALAAKSATITTGSTNLVASFIYPKFVLRSDSTTGSLSSPVNAYWGPTYNKKSNLLYSDKSYVDLIRYTPYVGTTTQDTFTLDDVSGSSLTGPSFTHVSGSRLAGSSLTAQYSYTSSLNAGINRFNVPLFGGFNGFNVAESDPFRNTAMSNATQTNNYAFYSISKAINTVSDPERVEMNLLVVPGVTNTAINDQMIALAETRGDTLAIIDLPDVYTPRHESATTYGLGAGGSSGNGTSNLDNVVTALKNRGINSSYACTYYPWVRIRDTLNNATLWAPPSIAALGVFSSTDKKAEPWFAPAGFTRGGLSEGAAGIPVVQVSEQLTSKQRDKLYEANINPIAQFPAEGIVVFGQKTLQVTRSALDRINVRRLMIFLKKEVSRIAARLLFSPNVEVTWNTFLGQVNPLMASVKTRFGLDDYRVILDKTTTTPDLIDQNIMYAKIFLKPTKAIEFIAIDFVITNSGASFQD